MAWTVEQKNDKPSRQSAEEAKIKLIIFNQTLRLQSECKLRIMHHVLFAQKLYEYVAKASKNLCNFLVFFFPLLFFCVTNFEFVTENQIFSLPPQRERSCSSLTLSGLGLLKLYFRRIRLKRALSCFCISFLLNMYYTFMDSKI